jgi:hypothetical protein
MTTSPDRIARRAYEIFQSRGEQYGQDWADWFQAERDIRVTETADRLMCAVLGHLNGASPRIGGSGVFVAPGIAITARHVIEDLYRTDPERADDLRARAPGVVHMPHNCALFQMTDTGKDKAPAATWSVTGTWHGRFADLALVEAVPDNQFGHEMRESMQQQLFPEWSLLPPPVGAQVVMFGVPDASLVISDTGWNFRAPYTSLSSVVLEAFNSRHDRGFFDFPGFFVKGGIGYGFSGGPVFWNGRLCGVASGVLFDKTYVASLWPFGLMEIKKLRSVERLANWFDERRIHAPDWPEIKNRISLRVDGAGAHFVNIELA